MLYVVDRSFSALRTASHDIGLSALVKIIGATSFKSSLETSGGAGGKGWALLTISRAALSSAGKPAPLTMLLDINFPARSILKATFA
jgi:hypothetical protein